MKKTFIRIFSVFAVAAILILGISAGRYWELRKTHKAEISTSAIAAQISELSDLSTAELGYRGLIHYSEGEIPLLTKKQFTMIYDAQIRAGIDLSDVQVDMIGNYITVSLPPAQIQTITIDPDSLEFYDEKFALFNTQNRMDTVTALQNAEDDAAAYVEKTDLLSAADKKAQTLITSFLYSILEDQEDLPKIEFKIVS